MTSTRLDPPHCQWRCCRFTVNILAFSSTKIARKEGHSLARSLSPSEGREGGRERRERRRGS
jgi:hypothetical protein